MTKERSTGGLAIEQRNARLEARECEALDALHEIGFRVTVHEIGRYVETDELRGIKAGFKSGTCYAVMYSRDGKRKHVSGTSAVEALAQAEAWTRWQAGLKDDAPNKFVPSVDFDPTAVRVAHRVIGDAAETELRRKNTQRKLLSFQTGSAEVVDAHGTPIGEGNQASQYREDETESEDTSR